MSQISRSSRFVIGAAVGFGSSILVSGFVKSVFFILYFYYYYNKSIFGASYDFLFPYPPYDLEADLTGKTYIVTGATAGIGKATAQNLADKNARVIMTYRNREKCTEIRRDIVLRSRNKQVFCRRCDISDFDSIQRFVSQLYKDETVDKVDGLINSAAVVNSKRKLTKHGIEKTLATNYLGPFLLTGLLLEKFLRQQIPVKIIFVNTKVAAEQNAELDLRKLFDAEGTHKYKWFDSYYNSKSALLMFSKELAEKLRDTNVSVVVTDPGKTQTKLFSQIWYEKYFPARWSRRTYEFFTDGARGPNYSIEPIICGLLNDDVKNGTFLGPTRESQSWGVNAENDSLRQQLWVMSEKWTNIASILREFRTDGDEQLLDTKEIIQAVKNRTWKTLWL